MGEKLSVLAGGRTLICVWAAALLCFAAGCTTMDVTTLKTNPADSYALHQETNGLVIAVEPITDKHQIKSVFDINLLKEGLLPILVVAQNNSATNSYIIAREKIAVLSDATGASSGSHEQPITSQTTATVFYYTGDVIDQAAPVGLPLQIIGMKMASNATVVQYNLADKEFYSRTLGPGERAQGFIYYQIPKGSMPSGSYHVVAKVTNPARNELILFSFPVNLTPPG